MGSCKRNWNVGRIIGVVGAVVAAIAVLMNTVMADANEVIPTMTWVKIGAGAAASIAFGIFSHIKHEKCEEDAEAESEEAEA